MSLSINTRSLRMRERVAENSQPLCVCMRDEMMMMFAVSLCVSLCLEEKTGASDSVHSFPFPLMLVNDGQDVS